MSIFDVFKKGLKKTAVAIGRGISSIFTSVKKWDDEDFKTGMNYAATVAFLVGVNVLAFILMSNHVHFVLACSGEKARAFITE